MPKIKNLKKLAEEQNAEAPVEEAVVSEVTLEKSDDIKSQDRNSTQASSGRRTKRVCQFCAQEKEPSYTDSSTLRKYMSDRFRIYPRAKTNVCSKHQRRVTKEIKYARHLSLLPFVPKV